MMLPPNQSWVSIHKFMPPLGEGTDSDNTMQRSETRAHIMCKYLERVDLLDRLNAILKDGQPKLLALNIFWVVEIPDK